MFQLPVSSLHISISSLYPPLYSFLLSSCLAIFSYLPSLLLYIYLYYPPLYTSSTPILLSLYQSIYTFFLALYIILSPSLYLCYTISSLSPSIYLSPPVYLYLPLCNLISLYIYTLLSLLPTSLSISFHISTYLSISSFYPSIPLCYLPVYPSSPLLSSLLLSSLYPSISSLIPI